MEVLFPPVSVQICLPYTSGRLSPFAIAPKLLEMPHHFCGFGSANA
uniref:Uncharacterized protein n=1 Tax=virus sp. ctJLD79 TaxID=2827987 RepID=A0A8S5REC0_9VIRU|nr:MAG TPA: hypothetical protein [virus sp. ctJLD79]